MTLKDYIETNKIHKDKFIALHNKNNKWIIAGQQDDPRLQDYMTLNVLSVDSDSCAVLVIQTDYEQDMQIAYYQMKAEQAERAKANPDSRYTKTTPTKKKKK